MTVEKLIQFLRLSVFVQDKDTVVQQDEQYLCMTDEDLLTYLNIVKTRNYSDVPSLEYMPEDSIYGLVLLAKKELYYTLAVKEAPLVDLGADNNNYLKESQRFDHYMKLIAQIDDEYDDWLENGGEDSLGTVKSYNVTISDRYGTRYNFENAAVPTVKLYVGNITENSVEFKWTVSNISRFFSYKVYISTEPIVDLFNLKNHIAESATCVQTIKDIHQTSLRITGLEPNTTYHIAVQATNMATLTGYAEVVIETLSDEEETEPDTDNESDTDTETEDGEQ